MPRTEMHHTMVDILDHSLLTGLRHDSDIVDLFLHGHKDLSRDKSKLIFKMALTYILFFMSGGVFFYFILGQWKSPCGTVSKDPSVIHYK